MNELHREDEIGDNEPSPVAGLDAQLTELIEFIWACESSTGASEHPKHRARTICAKWSRVLD